MDVQQEILSLREQLRYHNQKYYDQDAPEISDYDYNIPSLTILILRPTA